MGVLAGAVAIAMPRRAEAQPFAVGVQFGGPVYEYGYGPRAEFYAHERWEREQARLAHERERFRHRYGYWR